MGIVAKVRKHKTPASLARAVGRKLARSVGLMPKSKLSSKAAAEKGYDIIELPKPARHFVRGDNFSPMTVHQLSRTSALNGHGFFASPKVARRIEEMITHVAAQMAVVVFKSDRGNDLRVGLREEDFTLFARLLEAFFDTRISWSGKGFKALHPGDKNFASKTARSDNVSAMLRFGDVVSASVRVTLYAPAEGMTNSPDSKNQDLRYVRGEVQDKLAEPGLLYVGDLLGATSAQSMQFPVDVVYTWVNDEDPDWQEIYAVAKAVREAELLAALQETQEDLPEGDAEGFREEADSAFGEPSEGDDSDEDGGEDSDEDGGEDSDEDGGEDNLEGASDTAAMSRFKNRQELKYSLRSIEQYLPWVRKVFVFTNCAMPTWLNEVENLVWVRHEDVIAPEHLPTFNSHAIESYLHKIPNLSEHFIYFNDDFFVNQSLSYDYFFASNGVCQSNLEDYGVVNGVQNEEDADYLNAARNCVDLIQRDFGVSPTRLHKHSPYAMCKSVMFEMEDKYAPEFERTRQGAFRSASDISTASFLFHHYGYATRAVAYSGFRSKLVKNTARNLEADFKVMTEEFPVRTFCLNDGKDSHDDERWNTMICDFLEARFPLPTAAELGTSELGAAPVEDAQVLTQEAAE